MSTFGADDLGFGTLAGWAIQSCTAVDENKRANTLGPTGNDVASKLHDDTQQVTTVYKALADPAAPVIPAAIGADVNGVTLTGISISTDAEDFATMTLTGHVHEDGTHGTCRSIAHGMSLTAGFGASAFGCALGSATVRESSCEITCEHVDEPDGDGNTIAGENYNPKVEISVKVLGSGATIAAGFDRLEDGTEAENTGFQFQSPLRGIKPLAFA